MFKSERNISAYRVLADTTTLTTTRKTTRIVETDFSAKMSLCRACLVLLDTQDASYDLWREQDLAAKFFGCMATRDDEFWMSQLDEDASSNIVLHCICECCYHLVLKFHDFQCMCEESLLNFEKILWEVNANVKHKDAQDSEVSRGSEVQQSGDDQEEVTNQIQTESIGDIEEMQLIEAEVALEKENIAITEERDEQCPHGVANKTDCQDCDRDRGLYKMSPVEAPRKELPFKCTVGECGKSYARANQLTSHLKEEHRDSIRTYSCVEPNCTKTYAAMRSLKYHVRRHHNNEFLGKKRMHICEKCGKAYGRRSHLTRHQWVHRSKGERTYGCNHCVQRFYTEQNLKDHLLRRHSQKQNYRCRHCGRIFESRTAFTIHTKQKHATLRSKPGVKS